MSARLPFRRGWMAVSMSVLVCFVGPAGAASAAQPPVTQEQFMHHCGYQVYVRYKQALAAWKTNHGGQPKPVVEPAFPKRCLSDLERQLQAQGQVLGAGDRVRGGLKAMAVAGQTCARSGSNEMACKNRP